MANFKLGPRLEGDQVRPRVHEQSDQKIRDQDALLDAEDQDYGRAWEDVVQNEPRPFIQQNEFQEDFGEQVSFRERFDEDMYNDRGDHPAQGNTADVAMGDQRFVSDAEAYTEYAYRRAGDHRSGDESSVGQSRDPSDVSEEDDEKL